MREDRNPELSHDGTRIALEAADSENRTQDLTILELPGGAASRFTVDRGNDVQPIWSPDDSRIAFASDRQGAFTSCTRTGFGQSIRPGPLVDR